MTTAPPPPATAPVPTPPAPPVSITPPNQTLKVPDRYARVGVRRGFLPTPANSLRMIIEGEPGVGKTQFLMSMPGTLVLDFDRACQNTVGQQAAFLPINSWEAYLATKELLLNDARSATRDFQRIGFDTCDAFLALLDKQLLEGVNRAREAAKRPPLNTILEFGEKGAGYEKLRAALLRELADFEAAGYPYAIASHMQVKIETVGETRVVERRSVMSPYIMRALVRTMDAKARMYRSMDNRVVTATRQLPDGKGGLRTIETKTGETVVDTRYWLGLMPTDASDEGNDTKRRIPEFGGVLEIPLINGWTVFENAYNAAAVAARKIDEDAAIDKKAMAPKKTA